MTADPPSPGRRCRATTRAGKQCRNRALANAEPARCYMHAYPYRKPAGRGIYGEFFSEEELAALLEASETDALQDEIATARVMLRRLLAHLKQLGALSTEEMTTLAPLVLKTTQVIAALMRDQQMLQGGQVDPAFAAALDALGEEWEVAL